MAGGEHGSQLQRLPQLLALCPALDICGIRAPRHLNVCGIPGSTQDAIERVHSGNRTARLIRCQGGVRGTGSLCEYAQRQPGD